MTLPKSVLQREKEKFFEDDDGNVAVRIGQGSTNNALQFATDSITTTTFYLGEAIEGTTTASALWRIQRIQTASGVQIDWADGDSQFNNVWNNRESLSYS